VGTFSVPIAVGDPQARIFEPVDALVDTWSTYTVLPSALLRRLGVEPHTDVEFVLADESVVSYQLSRTWVEVGGRREFTLVVFGPDDAEPLLGAVTMEEVRLTPDIVAGELMPVRGRMK
jgi:predicted aspartyl protease